jgi:hypothetical protein
MKEEKQQPSMYHSGNVSLELPATSALLHKIPLGRKSKNILGAVI